MNGKKCMGFVETVYNGLEVCIGFRVRGGCMHGVYGWKVDGGLGMGAFVRRMGVEEAFALEVSRSCMNIFTFLSIP